MALKTVTLSWEAEFAREVADPSCGCWAAKAPKLGFGRVWLVGRPALREEDECCTRLKEVWRFWSRWCWWHGVRNLSTQQSELTAWVEATPSEDLVATLGDSRSSAADTGVARSSKTIHYIVLYPLWGELLRKSIPFVAPSRSITLPVLIPKQLRVE